MICAARKFRFESYDLRCAQVKIWIIWFALRASSDLKHMICAARKLRFESYDCAARLSEWFALRKSRAQVQIWIIWFALRASSDLNHMICAAPLPKFRSETYDLRCALPKFRSETYDLRCAQVQIWNIWFALRAKFRSETYDLRCALRSSDLKHMVCAARSRRK